MNDTTKIWILGSIVTVGGVLFAFLAKWFFNEVIKILNDIREELKNLSHVTTVQDLKVQAIEKVQDQQALRLDRHSNRIMDSEKRILIIEDKVK